MHETEVLQQNSNVWYVVIASTQKYLLPLLLIWINFNPNMDKQLHPLQSVGWNYLSIPHITGHVITYPCWD